MTTPNRAFVTVLFLAAAGPDALLAQPTSIPPRFPWRNDVDAARKEALAEGKPLLLVFR